MGNAGHHLGTATGGHMSILWIILIVLLVLAVFGYFARGRRA